jgi:hypothetical protein
MNNLIKALIKPVRVLIVASVVLSSCESDVWKDHYSYKTDNGESVSTLGATIEELGKNGNLDAQYFAQTLQNTYVYNGKNKTLVTYWDLLTDDQYFTVWLPTNIDETVWQNTYAKRNKSPEENIEVGRDFILNHVARFKHSVGTRTYERVKMMNDKSYTADHEKTFHTVGYNRTNIRCTNGLLHILNGTVPYSPNIYDYLTGNTVYKSANNKEYRYDTLFGKWFASYTVKTIDPNKSVPGEINMETGEKEWLDSVVITSNELMTKYKSFINVEDSSYAVVLPSPQLWSSVFDSVKGYFQYVSGYNIVGNDTIPIISDDDADLQAYWTRVSMLTDAFFNLKIQKNKGRDSVTSTLFKKNDEQDGYPYHIYRNPYGSGGLFHKDLCDDSVICSNGNIYIRNKWPYTDSVFHKTIKLEAESLVYSSEYKKASPKNILYEVNGKKTNVRVMQLEKNGVGYVLDFEIPDNLKGQYKLKLVFFANTGSDNPVTLVHPSVQYVVGDKYETVIDEKIKVGKKKYDKTYEIGSNLQKPDTIVVGPFTLRDCSYKNNSPKAVVKIKSALDNSNYTKYSHEMWLDCIMLEPVFE